MTTFHVIIPARYQSSRLPGKVLLDIAGKPMLQHVYEQAQASGAARVIIAVDDERVAACAHEFGAEVCMTATEHSTGTDRLAEVIEKLNFADDDIIINVQADEPLLPATLIIQLANDLASHATANVATLCAKIKSPATLFDPHVVKVVLDKNNYALYFSRAPIAWDREHFDKSKKQLAPEANFYKHIGIYAYRAKFVKQYVAWPTAPLEQLEQLEQLRILWHGERIHLSITNEDPGIGVDTPEDLEKVRELFS